MADKLRPSPALTLLSSYYTTVLGLQEYLSELLVRETHNDCDHHFLLHDADSEGYRTFVNTTVVASASPITSIPRFKIFTPMMYMLDVIDQAQEQLFSRTKGRPNDVITSGYRKASVNADVGRRATSRRGIVNTFVNTIITALQSKQWETLLQRIGADAMLHLLTETSIFVSLPNDCFCQMTGEPIVHMPAPKIQADHPSNVSSKRKSSDSKLEERQSKRLRLHASAFKTAQGVNKRMLPQEVMTFAPAAINYARARLFYSRAPRMLHSNCHVVGLSPKHILNRIKPAYEHRMKVDHTVQKHIDPDPRKQSADARHLAKYIFPRQFGLNSPFELSLELHKREGRRIPNFEDREEEIKARGPCKTPKRVKKSLPLLEQMIWRHGKCGYKPLRNMACPSKLKTANTGPLDSSVIMEMMAETSSPDLRSQAPHVDTSMDTSISPQGLTQAAKQRKYKPRFVEFMCSHQEVYRYVALVTTAVIPKRFWGCRKNFQLILKHVKSFICARRYETFSLHYILQHFRTSECDWLAPDSNQRRVPVTDTIKRRELLEEFLFWYFESFVLSLLKTTFYVTESSAFRNQVLYFRHDDWETLCTPLVEKLTSETFEKIPKHEAEEILRQRKMGYSFVRLLPKETGVRPIVNLKRRETAHRGLPEQSINQILQAAFQILSYEKQTYPERLGASVFGSNEVYGKLKDLKERLLCASSGVLPKLYFVKVDVQACFDTIEQNKLLEILKHLISEDIYMLHRHGQVTESFGRTRRIYVKKAVPADDHPHFLHFAAEIARMFRHTIFVDQVIYPFSRKQDILQLLEEHITENIVKIGDEYYRQMVGIPQGSVLSSLLCSFFYGDMEQNFRRYAEDSQGVLLRLIDDYLYITTSMTNAREFLQVMNEGHPEYGCFISRDKTLTNFDFDEDVTKVTPAQVTCFPWCGNLINMKNLSVSVDYSRYCNMNVKDTLTVDRGQRAPRAFQHKMLQLARQRTHILFFDVELNGEDVAYLNIYQNFLLVAMRMHAYIRVWGISMSKHSQFIHKTIRHVISYTALTIASKLSSADKEKRPLQKMAVIWLGIHAFHTIFRRKRTRFVSVLKLLNSELSSPRHRRFPRRFKQLVVQGLAGMMDVAF